MKIRSLFSIERHLSCSFNLTSSIAEALEFISFFVCSTSCCIFSEKETNKLSNSTWSAAEFFDALKWIKTNYAKYVRQNNLLWTKSNILQFQQISKGFQWLFYRFQNRCQVCLKTVYSFPYNSQLEKGD